MEKGNNNGRSEKKSKTDFYCGDYTTYEELKRKRRKREAAIRRRKRRRRRLIIKILCVCAVIVVAVLIAMNVNPLVLKERTVVQELGEKYNPKDNIEFVFMGNADKVHIDDSAVDVSQPGDYQVSYTYKGHEKTVDVKVKDTIAPKLEVKSVTADMSEKVTPEMFVKQVSDRSKVNISFAKKEKWNKEKTYEVSIVATDAAGNKTEKKAKLVRIKDKTAPVIKGVKDISILQGEDPDLKSGISVTDDRDPDPELKINSEGLDHNTPGTYKVTYTATDRSGNQTVKTQNVVVKENPELNEKVVYLTFDDGPSGDTEKILNILKKYNAKATFFVTGNNRKYDYLIKRAHDEGNSIGLHTYTHDYAKVYASEKAYFEDLQKISDLVENITGEKSYLIRFPGGSSNTVSRRYAPGLMTELTKEVREKGYQYFDWNCDSTDASGNHRPVQTLVANATSCSQKHIVILMHDTDAKDTTVSALPEIIENYRDRGYVFKGLSMDSFAPHHHVNN